MTSVHLFFDFMTYFVFRSGRAVPFITGTGAVLKCKNVYLPCTAYGQQLVKFKPSVTNAIQYCSHFIDCNYE
jgi:hypothetical protein